MLNSQAGDPTIFQIILINQNVAGVGKHATDGRILNSGTIWLSRCASLSVRAIREINANNFGVNYFRWPVGYPRNAGMFWISICHRDSQWWMTR